METGRVEILPPAGQAGRNTGHILLFATKIHLSTIRNKCIYFITNKAFYKKTVLTNHNF